jgi:hypothetical protein
MPQSQPAPRLAILFEPGRRATPAPAEEVFLFVAASQWKLGEARFTAIERGGRVEFLGADGRSLGRPFNAPLAELRAALVREADVRRGWRRTRRPLHVVVQCRLDGELVAARLDENDTRSKLSVEFLVARDEHSPRPATGPGHFSV